MSDLLKSIFLVKVVLLLLISQKYKYQKVDGWDVKNKFIYQLEKILNSKTLESQKFVNEVGGIWNGDIIQILRLGGDMLK